MAMLKINGYLFAFVALIFGLFNRVRVGTIVNKADDLWAANITNAGASCGFAIASGLCFLGYAIIKSKDTQNTD